MTPREMQNSFELTVNKFDSDQLVESHIVFFWLNKAVELLVKTRYSGLNSKGEAFEQSQKRIDDLRALVTETRISLVAGIEGINKPNSSIATLPNNYMFKVAEESQIEFDDLDQTSTIIKRVGIKEITNDTYASEIENPYSEYKLHYENAKPLRLFQDNYVELISDGNYQINYYYLRYIKLPEILTLTGDNSELPEHMHQEIVDKAVNLYLEATGNPRYQSNKVELNINE